MYGEGSRPVTFSPKCSSCSMPAPGASSSRWWIPYGKRVARLPQKQDELGRDWSAAVRFELPDQDVFVIDGLVWTWSAEVARGPLKSKGKQQRSSWPVSANGYDLHSGDLKSDCSR